jgi:hypothetical protein
MLLHTFRFIRYSFGQMMDCTDDHRHAASTRRGVERLEQLRSIVENARTEALAEFNVKGRI